MTEYELGIQLKKMYDDAPKGEIVTYMFLFGIKFSKEIKANNYRYEDIVKASGIPKSYTVEVYNGAKMAKYVELKKTV